MEELIDKLVQHYTGVAYLDEVREAKDSFSRGAGSFDENHPDFEMKMFQFSDWFLFTRKLRTVNLAPADYAPEDPKFNKSGDEANHFANLKKRRHSLYDFVKIKGEDMILRDLFAGEKITIKNTPLKHGFTSGQIFEARLIPQEDSWVFTKGFCFHPASAYRFINGEVKKLRKVPEAERSEAREALIQRLFRMKYGIEIYRHLKMEDIYSNSSKLGL